MSNERQVDSAVPLEVLSAIAERTSNAVLTTDHEGRITWVNPAFVRVTGYSLQEALGRTPGELLQGADTDPDLVRLMGRCQRRGAGFRVEVLNYRSDGQPFWNSVEAVPIHDGQGTLTGFVSVQTDISSAKDQTQALERACHEALTTERLKSEFLAVMSHEIRTPVNGIIGLLDLALSHSHPQTMLRHVSTARELATSLTQIVNDTLDLSRMDAGRLPREDTLFDPEKLILAALSSVATEAHRKGVMLRVACPVALPARLRGAPSRIRQILINLLGNATKFTEVGVIRLAVSWDRRQAMLCLRVSDTGPGIPGDSLGKIFEPYEQVGGQLQVRHRGVGLGLSIVYRLVQWLGGSVEVQSQLDVGTTFTVRVPLEPGPEEDVVAPLRDLRILLSGRLAIQEPSLRHWLIDAGARVERWVAGPIPVVDSHVDTILVCDASEDIPACLLAAGAAPVLVVASALESFTLAEGLAGRVPIMAVRPLPPRALCDQLLALAEQHHGAAPTLLPCDPPVVDRPVRRLLLVEDDAVTALVAEQFLTRAGWEVRCADTAGEAIRLVEEDLGLAVIVVDLNLPDRPGLDVLRAIQARTGLGASGPAVALWTAQSGPSDVPSECQALSHMRIPKPIEPAGLVRAIERLSAVHDRAAPQDLAEAFRETGF